jgi:outer membrane protein TolC
MDNQNNFLFSIQGKILQTILLIGFATSSTASQTQLRWTSVLKEFKEKNLELQSVLTEKRTLEFKLKAARSGYWPQVSFNTYTPLASSTSIAQSETTVSLNITQNLFSGFSTMAQVQESEANLILKDSQNRQAEAFIIFQLRSAYLEILNVQQNIKLNQDIIKRRQQNYDMVKLRYTTGKENKGSVLLAEAYLKQAEFEKLQNENLLKKNLQKLASLTPTLDLNSEFREDTEILPNINFNVALSELSDKHPEVQMALAQKQITEAQLKNLKSANFPTLALQYSRYQDQNWSAGLNLSWNIFNGGKDMYLIQGQQELEKLRDLDIIQVKNSLLEKLMIAQVNAQEASIQENIAMSFLKAAIVREQISRSKYNNGLSNFDDWDQIQADLIIRQKNLLKSKHEKLVQQAEWLKAQGKGLP